MVSQFRLLERTRHVLLNIINHNISDMQTPSKKQRIESGQGLLQVPAAVICACIAPFAKFDEV